MQIQEILMRINRHQMFLQIAQIVSQRSTCYRLNVGAVLVQNNNIMSIGYNGAPAGDPHCIGNSCTNSDGICDRAKHAEFNAIKRASHIQFCDASLYVTDSPCESCATQIINAQISSVFFERPYRKPDGLIILTKNNIPWYRITPAGYIVDSQDRIVDENLELQM